MENKLGKAKVEMIKLTGCELGEYENIEELRNKAFDYYKNNLQGKIILHPEIGEIIFSGKGIRKVINSSADVTKLRFLPKLKEIIEAGNTGEWEFPNKIRTDEIKKFMFITTPILLNNESKIVIVNIAQYAEGNKFYNLNYRMNS